MHICQSSRQELKGEAVQSIFAATAMQSTPSTTDGCSITHAVCNRESRYSAEECLCRPDGTCIFVEYCASPIRKDGEQIGAVLTIRDITQHKMAAEALRASEHRFRDLVEFSSDWVWEVDAQARYIYASPKVKELLGYAPEEIIGKTPFDLMPAEEAERVGIIFAEIAKSQRPFAALENVNRHKDGRLVVLETSGVPVFDGGELVGFRGVDRDITERKQSDAVLKRSQASLLEAQRIAKLGNWEWDIVNDKLYWSDEIYRIFGLVPEQFKATYDAFLASVHPGDRDTVCKTVEDTLATGKPYALDHRVIHPDGRELIVHERAEVTFDKNGAPILMQGTVQDITERKQAEIKLRQAARVFESTNEGVVVTDPEQKIVAINSAFTRITGYCEEEVLGKVPTFLQSGRHQQVFYRQMWTSINATDQWQGEIWNRRKNGEIFPEWLNISVVRGEAGELLNYVGVFSDITTIKQSAQQLEYLANHDPLTGLPNRALFTDRLESAIARARRHCNHVALLFIDVDRFKVVNDTLGHHIGDQLLKCVAERISRCVRDEDTVTRIGGDEFTVIQEGDPHPEAAAVLARRILKRLARPLLLEQHEIIVSASIGISMYPEDSDDAVTLIKNADAAMYQAKELGRNGYQYYSPEMTAAGSERLKLEGALHYALERNEFLLHYQPQIDVHSGRIIGVEALLRWQHPQLGMVPPMQFIPLAEDTGLIGPIGAWVLQTACKQAKAWQTAGLPPIKIAVNVSGRQISHDHVVDKVQTALAVSGLDSRYLDIEVTESILMEDTERAIMTLNALKQAGVSLSIDDFGTGYSSLSYLKRFPINKLKIDKTFVDGLPDNKDDTAITQAIIAMAHSLGLSVVAEGVETSAQLEFLRTLKCKEVQGYFFSKPLPAQELEQLLREEQAQLV
jgi:diguanylate cyclase (GGDEF)-like protein/PAS domain S-box-containing protein